MSRSPQPTAEQKEILNASSRVVRINARAGTGKTTTLRMLAEKHRDKRILYLVFNARAQKQAEETFPSNVQVRTIHSLAFKSVRPGYHWELGNHNYSPADLLNEFRDAGSVQQTLANMTFKLIGYFLNSSYDRLEEAIGPFASKYLTQGQNACFQQYSQKIIDICRHLTTDWYHGRVKCPHDFYLKLSHKEGKLQRLLNNFDLVLVDEGQDMSPVMLDAIKRCTKRIFLVGDTHQQLYAFRYAVDAMRHFDCDQELELSLSFRFGEPIARLVTAFIRKVKAEHGFLIRGHPQRWSRVDLSSRLESVIGKDNTAILCRTNFGLFENAVKLYARQVPFYFERNIGPLLSKTLDVYRLSQQNRSQIRDPFIESFESLQTLKDYAEEGEDAQLLYLVKIVREYNDRMPKLVFDLLKYQKQMRNEQEDRAVVLSTVHTAKGQQYRNVLIYDDIVTTLDKALKEGVGESDKSNEAANVMYVAMTRAIEHLYLPPIVKESLSLNWSELIRAPLQVTASRTSHNPTRDTRHYVMPMQSSQVKILPTSQGAHTSDYKIGQHVRTHMGIGRIIHISNDRQKYLIALDNQPIKVWEPAYELREERP